tara:strand:+ start:399 stop:2435 length:2037 start_codon:yes stop_codon:yes gene_type:complete
MEEILEPNDRTCVSVIIPAYNRSQCIRTAIDSVLNQDWKNIEVIVVDDASTDNTVDLINEINDHRVKLLQRDSNGGAAAARNDGIIASRGEYIALLDSDDKFLPGKIRTQVQALIQSKGRYRLSCTGLTLELTSENIIVEKFHPEPVDEFISLFMGCDLSPGSTLMAEKKLFDEIGYFDTSLRRFEDWDWLIKAVKISPILRINESLSHVYNIRSRLSKEVAQAANDFIKKRRFLYPEVRKSLHQQANSMIWMQSVGTALRERRYHLLIKSSFHAFSACPSLFLKQIARTVIAKNLRVQKPGTKDKNSKRRITFVLHGITAGGAERVLVYIANWLASKNWNVSIIHFQSETHVPFYDINKDINIISLGMSNKDHINLSFTSRLFKYISHAFKLRKNMKEIRTEVAVSFMDAANILTIFSLIGSGIPVISCERNNPSMHKLNKKISTARKLLYPMSSMITVQTKEAGYYFPETLRKNIYVIPNPIPIYNFNKFYDTWDSKNKKILSIGRLDQQKGFDILIKSFYIFNKNHPGWTLTIVGEGQERHKLQSIIEELKLENQINLPGSFSDISPFLNSCSIFILPSRYEGFPNALLEAMASGRPVIATNCKSGPSEILMGGSAGLLVPPENPSALAEAISKLALNPDLANELRNIAIRRVADFEESIIVSKWENLIDSVIRG